MFSPRDITLRDMLAKRKNLASHQLRAQMAASLGDADSANESYSKYVDSQWYSRVKEDRNERMAREYDHYKDITPLMGLDREGKPVVKGLI